MDKPQRSFSAQTADGVGSIDVFEEHITLRLGHRARDVKKGYVESLTKKGSLALGKVEAELAYYDMLGSRETVVFAMHEADFRGLKSILGK
ncbi:hypothetical protein COT29_00640 [Candidatus Micrarchaeota archaeon CG08_land_8_20_14_0_20_59_11]|nr:MAG: hypothetical protein COT29_00640 [Candidatus Micrarchaeota archaeon CG08_land_8_20_14_0_20_59_11]